MVFCWFQILVSTWAFWSVSVTATPLTQDIENCPCSDMKEISSRATIKLEEYIDQSVKGLLDSIDTTVSASIAVAVRGELDNVLNGSSLTNDSQIALERLANMTIQVCGRIKGYQFGSPYAFYYQSKGINSYYMDGVSLTYGHPGVRKHIWSFVTGADDRTVSSLNCPCTRTDQTYGGTVPRFVGNNYFCDTANHVLPYGQMFGKEQYDDPLWDGNGCIHTTSCCCFNSPPFFCTELPKPTTFDIEMRICNVHVLSNSDTRLEIVELYVQ